MKIEIKIIKKDDGTVRCTLEPPKALDSWKKVADEEDRACKILWIKIDELLQELNNIQ